MKIEEIRNMKIDAGVHQWNGDGNGLTAGSLTVTLPNGTKIQITSVEAKEGDYANMSISVHRLKDTELTIFDKVTKKQDSVKGTTWTTIKSKGDEE